MRLVHWLAAREIDRRQFPRAFPERRGCAAGTTAMSSGRSCQGSVSRRDDRDTNIRRIISALPRSSADGAVICAVVAHQRHVKSEAAVPGVVRPVYVATPLEECERRDVKGPYAKARRGEIVGMTGRRPVRIAMSLRSSCRQWMRCEKCASRIERYEGRVISTRRWSDGDRRRSAFARVLRSSTLAFAFVFWNLIPPTYPPT
jgi:hypothetical protein